MAPVPLRATFQTKFFFAALSAAILAHRGLVVRTPAPHDRRSCRVAVTEPGRALLRESRTRRDAYLARRLASFDVAERATLDRALALLERFIAEER